jgi:hypothetical protein
VLYAEAEVVPFPNVVMNIFRKERKRNRKTKNWNDGCGRVG